MMKKEIINIVKPFYMQNGNKEIKRRYYEEMT